MKIGDVAFGGDGVGRSEDLVIFVPFTVDGDEAEVEITEVKKRYARGRLIRIIAPSHYRTTPRCLYYARCGGCRMQHIAYLYQLELKRRQVAEAFRRIAKLSLPPVASVIASPRPYGYRGKAEFHLAGGRIPIISFEKRLFIVPSVILSGIFVHIHDFDWIGSHKNTPIHIDYGKIVTFRLNP